MPADNFVVVREVRPSTEEQGRLSRDDLVAQLREALLPANGKPTHRVLLGQVLKSALLVGQPLVYKAPNSKSGDLTGKGPLLPSPKPMLYNDSPKAHRLLELLDLHPLHIAQVVSMSLPIEQSIRSS